MSYPTDVVNMMWESVTMIEAQEQLKSFSAADWPNMKKADRSKLHKELHRQAYPNSFSKKNLITVHDLQKMLGR